MDMRCHLSFHLEVHHEPALVPGRKLNQGHESSAHRDPSVIPVYLILISVSDILFLFVCVWVPDRLTQIK